MTVFADRVQQRFGLLDVGAEWVCASRLADHFAPAATLKNGAYFFSAAAEGMRRILVEQARRRLAAKRGFDSDPAEATFWRPFIHLSRPDGQRPIFALPGDYGRVRAGWLRFGTRRWLAGNLEKPVHRYK